MKAIIKLDKNECMKNGLNLTSYDDLNPVITFEPAELTKEQREELAHNSHRPPTNGAGISRADYIVNPQDGYSRDSEPKYPPVYEATFENMQMLLNFAVGFRYAFVQKRIADDRKVVNAFIRECQEYLRLPENKILETKEFPFKKEIELKKQPPRIITMLEMPDDDPDWIHAMDLFEMAVHKYECKKKKYQTLKKEFDEFNQKIAEEKRQKEKEKEKRRQDQMAEWVQSFGT